MIEYVRRLSICKICSYTRRSDDVYFWSNLLFTIHRSGWRPVARAHLEPDYAHYGPFAFETDGVILNSPSARGFFLGSSDNLTRAAGVIIISLSAGAALLPFLSPNSGTVTVGMLLLLAGIAEMFAATLRRELRGHATSAGAATTVAGLLFLFNARGELLSNISVVAAWLLARACILLLTSQLSSGSVRMWIRVSALTDLGLGLALVAGLSVVGLVVTLFGPAPQVVASFAWVLALSFVATGTLLLEVASCESRPESKIQSL